MAQKTEKMLPYATFFKSLNPRKIEKSVADILIRIRFESSLWISVSGCKLTILPDIQPAKRIVIISVGCALFVTSHCDVKFIFQIQRFGEVF